MTTTPPLKPVDPRAGRLCSACNQPRPTQEADVIHHCPPPYRCGWWKCRGCHAWNDPQGRNDRTDLAGHSKDGSQR